MKKALISLFLVTCIFSQNAISRDQSAKPAKQVKPAILFEVDSVIVEKRPKDINGLTAIFERDLPFDSNNVEAIESLNRQNVFGKPDLDVGYLVYFEFYTETEGKWEFEFVYDAGIASGAFVDEEVILFSDLDLWLTAAKPIVKTVALKKGWHTFEFLALENCCGSPMRIRVKKPDWDKFKIVSVDSLQLRAVSK
jgi:hypothetical protein